MNRKNMLTIIPLIGIAAIPQLIYFWLAPDTSASLTVYIFGTIFTIVHLTLCFILMWKHSTRRVAATIIVGSIIYLIVLITSAFLLLNDSTVRTSIYSLSIHAVLYLICTLSLMFAIEPSHMLQNNSNKQVFDSTPRNVISRKKQTRFNLGQHDDNTCIVKAAPPLPER